MARSIAAEWLRFSRQRVNQVALLLLVLATFWHFWSDYRSARSLDLLADQGADLVRFQTMPSAEIKTLTEADVWRWYRAGELVLAVPNTFGLAYWIWAWARALWLLLAAIAVGGEFQWGTLRWRLSLGLGRWRWLLAKVSVLVLSALAATILLWLVVAGAGLYVHRQVFGSLSWAWSTPEFWIGQAAVLLRAWIGFWPWIGLGILLGMVGRSTVPTAALGVLMLLLDWFWGSGLIMLAASQSVSSTLPRWLLPDGPLGLLYRWTVGYNVAAISFWAGLGTVPEPVPGLDRAAAILALRVIPTSPERALGVALGFTLLTVGLAAWSLVQRDVTR
jgi:ABC-type transport system involved in multi-copper enzyme maturation permease subunit